MKAIMAGTVAVIGLVFCSGAQTFKKGDQFAQGGIGVVLPGVPGSMSFPPVGAGFEYGVSDYLSTGVFFALSGIDDSDIARMVVSLAFEGNFHPMNLPFVPSFALKDKIDPYAGVLAGANVLTGRGSRILWGVIAGSRVYVTDVFSIYAELGRGIGIFHLGVSVKL
jgi:hypothetical protein